MARFSFADFGLVSRGMDEAADERTKRERAEEDRKYELDRRKRAEEEAVLAQEEARRARAYQEELRATLPKYLSGGEKAIPAQAAVEGEALEPNDHDQGTIGRAARAAKPAQDNNEGLYEALKGVAAKHGRLDHYEVMKDRIKKAADEGVLDFMKKARQGAPESELVETFNKSGKIKLAGLRKVNDDEYAAVTEDGQPMQINLTSLNEAMLNPQQYLAHKDKTQATEARLTAQREGNEARNVAASARLEAQRAGLEARAGVFSAQEEAARARAERDRAVANRDPAAKPKNWTAFDNEVRRVATDMSTTEVAGRKNVDFKTKYALVSMAQALTRADPDAYASPAAAVAAAAEQLGEARGKAAREVAEFEKGGGSSIREAYGVSRDERIAQRTDEILKKSAPRAPATPAPAAAPSAPQRAPAGQVAQIASDEEFAALPSGAIFVGPDGKQRRKP